MLRVPYDELLAALHKATLQLGLKGERAALCARLFAETTRDGVYTHGLNRFSRFAAMIHNGSLIPTAEPERIAGTAVLERWDGHLGPGNLAAHAAMSRAVAMAKQSGLGAVALARTTHWMRGGTYGWLAAESGVFGICWTNTMPNLPPWGATSPAVGNNPLILAIPRSNGEHVVLDMAMSQFSYGTLAGYTKRNTPLPFDGGFDASGALTKDAAAIESSQRALPIGYWKGSGLAIALDLMATMLSVGNATHQIPTDPMRESGVSQFFLAIDPSTLNANSSAERDAIADAILASVHNADPIDPAKPPRYPGEQTIRLREENLRLGVPVDIDVWEDFRHQYAIE
jgi:3-dehydro-L-gulonate 2-dehydrogenase